MLLLVLLLVVVVVVEVTVGGGGAAAAAASVVNLVATVGVVGDDSCSLSVATAPSRLQRWLLMVMMMVACT